MDERWRRFADDIPALACIRDPFVDLGRRPKLLSERQWLWFVPDGENHGMTEKRLTSELDEWICLRNFILKR
jgi:hypothetical protein